MKQITVTGDSVLFRVGMGLLTNMRGASFLRRREAGVDGGGQFTSAVWDPFKK